MSKPSPHPGSRPWGFWRYELNLPDEPATHFERVKALHERGLLRPDEVERLIKEGEAARKPRVKPHSTTTPKEAAAEIERRQREHENEAIAIAGLLDLTDGS